MSRIKILHLITTLDTGGAERTLQRLLKGMDHDAFDNSVVSLVREGPIASHLRDAGIRVQSLNMRRGVPAPGALLRLRSILRRERPDILQTWLYHADLLGLLATRLAQVPRLVWNVRCGDMDMRHYSVLSRATRRTLAMTSHVPDAVIVNSRAGLSIHEGYGYSPRRWELIPNGIDAVRFARDEAGRNELRKELGIAPDAPVIGTVGRFDAMKDYRTFVAAAAAIRAQFPALRIVMAGPGIESNNAELVKMLGSAGLSGVTSILGERSDVSRVLSALDVFCLTSIGEGFPNAVAEAMACEVPVVVTDVGDTAWITGSSGVTPRDWKAFAARVCEVLQMPEATRRSQGIALRRRVESEFALRRMIDKYEGLFADLAAGASAQ
jgi:glycosyltransferase involved in cell wall biosynthesis